MMKSKILLSLLTVGLLAAYGTGQTTAQVDKQPQLAEKGRNIEEIVPKGWEEQHVIGDLNKDGIKDIVLVALPNNPAHIKTREDGYQYNFNPKLLAIYFGSSSGVYKRFKVWDKALPARADEYADCEADLSITPKGALDITVSFWTSMGTADAGNTTYRYRFQSGDFYLIGQEYTSFSRMTGKGETVSINYLTGDQITTTGNIMENKGLKTRKTKLKKEPLARLGSFYME